MCTRESNYIMARNTGLRSTAQRVWELMSFLRLEKFEIKISFARGSVHINKPSGRVINQMAYILKFIIRLNFAS